MKSLSSALYVGIFAFIISVHLASAQTSLPSSVINELASRESRYHHYLWHQVRENWNRFSDSTRRAFRDIGWEPPRPARRYDSQGNSYSINDNNSGEDFLYMHRQMITKVNSLLARAGRPRLTRWASIPDPSDRTWPVSGTYTIPGNPGTTNYVNTRKTSSYYRNTIVPAERNFKDPNQLRRWSLGELGARLEVTIHGWLHMRFSSRSSYGYRNSYRGTIPYIDKRWDNPQYNWLGDTYASHVHPIFWQIHGWVDDRIEDWRRANGLSSIRWRGTWTGGPMSTLGSVLRKEGGMSAMGTSKSGEENDVMEEAMQIFLDSGVPESNMFEIVIPDPTSQKPRKRACKSKRKH